MHCQLSQQFGRMILQGVQASFVQTMSEPLKAPCETLKTMCEPRAKHVKQTRSEGLG